uniref:Endo/exonuclease/phosphatase domain-containing protein n=1 Tax=Rhodnius prolixus TaxID=13249 RepID=T1I8R4_RHOPR
MSILQWNMNGYPTHKEELRKLIKEKSPLLVCLQETHLKPRNNLTIPHYNCYRRDFLQGQRACGGVGILVRDDIICQKILINSNFQTVIVKVCLLHPITVCSIYIPPRQNINLEEMNSFLRQIQGPTLLLGDFNAHHIVWGSEVTESRGRELLDAIEEQNLILLNDGSKTFLSSSFGTMSAIDLSISSVSLVTRLEWNVLEDSYGSDHFPICIHMENGIQAQERPKRWRIKQANWELYAERSSLKEQELQGNIEELSQLINQKILLAAKAAIPETKVVPHRITVPWWSEECQEAVRKRRRAIRRFKRHCTRANFIEYKKANAEARRLIKLRKKITWANYVSSLNRNTPQAAVRNIIKRISGRGRKRHIAGLEKDGQRFVQPVEIAECLASYIAEYTFDEAYDTEFLAIKRRRERIEFNIQNEIENSTLNVPFSMDELESALERCKNSAPGLDNIPYLFLKKLTASSKRTLLFFYNYVFSSNSFPSPWKLATVIPVYKEGKEGRFPKSYRPISLTNCICKVMERM